MDDSQLWDSILPRCESVVRTARGSGTGVAYWPSTIAHVLELDSGEVNVVGDRMWMRSAGTTTSGELFQGSSITKATFGYFIRDG